MNTIYQTDGRVKNPVQLSIELKNQISALQAQYINAKGEIDPKISVSTIYANFLKNLSTTANVDLGKLEKSDLKAFLINLYNTMIFHFTVEKQKPSTEEQQDFFHNKYCYLIQNEFYSLNKIYESLLTCQTKKETLGSTLGNYLSNENNIQVDFRVHFSLDSYKFKDFDVPISYFKSDTLENDLDLSTSSFLRHLVTIDENLNVVKLPNIVFHCKNNFGESDLQIIENLSSYFVPLKEFLEKFKDSNIFRGRIVDPQKKAFPIYLQRKMKSTVSFNNVVVENKHKVFMSGDLNTTMTKKKTETPIIENNNNSKHSLNVKGLSSHRRKSRHVESLDLNSQKFKIIYYDTNCFAFDTFTSTNKIIFSQNSSRFFESDDLDLYKIYFPQKSQINKSNIQKFFRSFQEINKNNLFINDRLRFFRIVEDTLMSIHQTESIDWPDIFFSRLLIERKSSISLGETIRLVNLFIS